VQMIAIPFLLFDGHLFDVIDTRVWGTWLIWLAAVLTVWSIIKLVRTTRSPARKAAA